MLWEDTPIWLTSKNHSLLKYHSKETNWNRYSDIKICRKFKITLIVYKPVKCKLVNWPCSLNTAKPSTLLYTCCHADPKKRSPQGVLDKEQGKTSAEVQLCEAPAPSACWDASTALVPLRCLSHRCRHHFCPLQKTQKRLPQDILKFSWTLTGNHDQLCLPWQTSHAILINSSTVNRKA